MELFYLSFFLSEMWAQDPMHKTESEAVLTEVGFQEGPHTALGLTPSDS